MRALLVVNPVATTTSHLTSDVLVTALHGELKLDVAVTQRRGHAHDLAREAAVDGLDLVVVQGGDGTVNEVVNGLLADGPHGQLPSLGIVPGGSTNVLVRSLGLPADPVEATGALLAALRQERRRTIGLGRADDRWFTFCAGLGLDAEVVSAVEERRREGEEPSPGLYVRTAISHFFRSTDRSDPAITLSRPGLPDRQGVFLGIVANTSPWTYLGSRPVDPCPRASFDSGLDLFALTSLRTTHTLRQVRRMLSPRPLLPRGRKVVSLHDAAEFTLRSDRPLDLQVDGDHVGARTQVRFRAVPAALRIAG
jgi:diacylglycerol kinase family enzyme